MKIAGITRIRNEEGIINDTINHFADFCSGGLFIYDDCSKDGTLEIIKKSSHVRAIIEGKNWDSDRTRAEYESRQQVLELAQKTNPDWICYFDADERIDIDRPFLDYIMKSPDYNAINCRLFDAYITKDDFALINANHTYMPNPSRIYEDFYTDKFLDNYSERKWFGPEYRNIPMFFRNMPGLRYHLPDQRIATYRGEAYNLGFVKHYGKAISIKEWEKTCEYYISHFPVNYKKKWLARKGKAVHTKSDFGRPLITWDEKEKKGILLNE